MEGTDIIEKRYSKSSNNNIVCLENSREHWQKLIINYILIPKNIMILRKNKSDYVENSVVSSFFGKLQQKTQSIVRSTLKNARALLAIGMMAGWANALEQEDHASSQKQSPSGWSLSDAQGGSIDNLREIISSQITYHTQAVEDSIKSVEKDFITMPHARNYSYKNSTEIQSKIMPQIKEFEIQSNHKLNEAIESWSYKPSWFEQMLGTKVIQKSENTSYTYRGSASWEWRTNDNIELGKERGQIVATATGHTWEIHSSVDNLSNNATLQLESYAKALNITTNDLIRQYNRWTHFSPEIDSFLDDNFAKKRGVSIEKTTQIQQTWQWGISVPILPVGLIVWAGIFWMRKKIKSLGGSLKKWAMKVTSWIKGLLSKRWAAYWTASDATERLKENIAEIHETREKRNTEPIIVARETARYSSGKRYSSPQENSAGNALDRLKKSDDQEWVNPPVTANQEERNETRDWENKDGTTQDEPSTNEPKNVVPITKKAETPEDSREYLKLREAITKFDEIMKDIWPDFEQDCQLVRSSLIKTYSDKWILKESWGEVYHALGVLMQNMSSALQKNMLDKPQIDALRKLKIFYQQCFAPTYRDDTLGDKKALWEIKNIKKKHYPSGTKLFVKMNNYTGFAKVISSSWWSILLQIRNTNEAISLADLETYMLQWELIQEQSSATVDVMLQKDWLTPKEKCSIHGFTYYITDRAYTSTIDRRQEKIIIANESPEDRMKRITIKQEYVGVYTKNAWITEGWIFRKLKNGNWCSMASQEENMTASLFGEPQSWYIELHPELAKRVNHGSSNIDPQAKDLTKDILTPIYSAKLKKDVVTQDLKVA